MIIDLHCHTLQRSLCSTVDEEDLIQHAVSRGLGGLAFTDHDCLAPPERLRQLNEKYRPFRIFTGIEITLAIAEGKCDFLVIGVHDPVLATALWRYGELARWVRGHGGWMAMAHPYRFARDLPAEVEADPPDALEIRSTNIDPKLFQRIEDAAKGWGCRVVAASDAHCAEDVGRHAIELLEPVATDAELVAELRAGAFRIVG